MLCVLLEPPQGEKRTTPSFQKGELRTRIEPEEINEGKQEVIERGAQERRFFSATRRVFWIHKTRTS